VDLLTLYLPLFSNKLNKVELLIASTRGSIFSVTDFTLLNFKKTEMSITILLYFEIGSKRKRKRKRKRKERKKEKEGKKKRKEKKRKKIK